MSHSIFIILGCASLLAACGKESASPPAAAVPGPSQVMTRLIGDVQDGKVDDALTLMSARSLVRDGGSAKVRDELLHVNRDDLRGLIGEEHISGDSAEVSVQYLDAKGGPPSTTRYQLIKEDGVWKVDNKT